MEAHQQGNTRSQYEEQPLQKNDLDVIRNPVYCMQDRLDHIAHNVKHCAGTGQHQQNVLNVRDVRKGSDEPQASEKQQFIEKQHPDLADDQWFVQFVVVGSAILEGNALTPSQRGIGQIRTVEQVQLPVAVLLRSHQFGKQQRQQYGNHQSDHIGSHGADDIF